MRKLLSMLLSATLLLNLVGCINVTITPESNTTNEVKTEEKVQQEVPQKQEETKKEEVKKEEPAKKEEAKKDEVKKEEPAKKEETEKEEQPKEEAKKEEQAPAKEEDNTGMVECDWITKQDFIDTMTEMLNEQGIPFEYMELVEQNNDPMFIVTDNVGICGYVDEANNVTQIAVIGLEGSSYEEYQYAGQLFGISIAVFTEDAELVNDITTIFDQKDGIFNTENFIYEYHESDTGEVIITITPSHLANGSYKYHIDENGDKYVTKDEVI